MANGFNEVRIASLNCLEYLFAGAGVQAIEYLRDGPDAAMGFAAQLSRDLSF